MMSTLVQVVLTRLSDGETFEGTAWFDSGKYEAIWYEGGLRLIFLFDESGKQIGMSKYSLRRKEG